MEGLSQNMPQVKYNEQGFPVAETLSDSETEDDESTGAVEGSESTEATSSHEQLSAVVDRARYLEDLMKERDSESFTKKFMSSAQAEAFTHAFEMSAASIENGDVEGFNQELSHLASCFEGYGTNQGEGMRENLGSIDDIRKGFSALNDEFDSLCDQVKDVPGIDIEKLKKLQAYFGQIDDFHQRLYEASFTMLDDGEQDIKEESHSDEDILEGKENGMSPESKERFARILSELSNEARNLKGKLTERYDNRLTHQLMSPQKAGVLVNSLEAASDAIRTGDKQALEDAMRGFSSSFNGYGEDQNLGGGVRENKDNLGATVHAFSQLIEGFSQFASQYEQENPDSEIIPGLQRIKNGLARVDDFNLRLKSAASRTF